MSERYISEGSETPDQFLIKREQNSARIRSETLRLKNLFCFGKIARMSEPTANMEVVPQVSLELQLRGDPPALETITYSNSADRFDTASGLQQRTLTKAVATALTLFRRPQFMPEADPLSYPLPRNEARFCPGYPQCET